MSEQFRCAQDLRVETAKINLVLEARRIVVWAGELTEEGEEVGGIGAQNNRASRLLRLHIGVILRARHMRAGPEIYPTIVAAHNGLIERLSTRWRPKPRVQLANGFVEAKRKSRKANCASG